MNGTWTIHGNGVDIWATSDQFRYVWQPITGDTLLSARVTAQANTDVTAQAGLLFCQSVDPATPFYELIVMLGGGLAVQYRVATGPYTGQLVTLSGTVPAYTEVARQGNRFSASTSTDGANWSLVPHSTLTKGI